jgi:hypothetical protein
MTVVLYFSLQLLIRFFDTASDAAVTVRYVFLSGKPEPYGIAPMTARVLWFFGVLGILMAGYLSLHPIVNGLFALSLLLSAIANIWLGFLLNHCRKKLALEAYLLSKKLRQR